MHADAPFANILKLNYDTLVRWGRMYEIELIARDVLKRPSGAAWTTWAWA